MHIKIISLVLLYCAAMLPMLVIALLILGGVSTRVFRPNIPGSNLALLILQTAIIFFSIVTLALFGTIHEFELFALSLAVGLTLFGIPYRLLRHRRMIVISQKYLLLYRTLGPLIWFTFVVLIYFILWKSFPGFDFQASFSTLSIAGLSSFAIWLATKAINAQIQKEEKKSYWDQIDNLLHTASDNIKLQANIKSEHSESWERVEYDIQSTFVKIKEMLGLRLSNSPSENSLTTQQLPKVHPRIGIFGGCFAAVLISFAFYIHFARSYIYLAKQHRSMQSWEPVLAVLPD